MKMFCIACIVLLIAGVSMTAAPAATTAPPAVPQARSASFDADAATAAYMAQISPGARARSDAYFEGGYWLILWDALWAVGISWLLLATRFSTRMRNLAIRITRMRWLQTAIYAVQYIVLVTLLTFPWTMYTDFIREHQYGLSNQSFGGWSGDQLKALILGLIIGSVGLVVLYGVIRRAPRTWWLWATGGSMVFMAVLATIAPVYLAPLFNTYKPLPDSVLKQQILSLARANGIPAGNVYEFDASRQSKRISANVSGMFGTTRISLNDNLLQRSTPEEIKAVLGHEMGHYVLNHVYKGLVFFGIVVLIGFAFVYWAFRQAAARWGDRWGIAGAGDVAGLPLITALFTVYMLLVTPVINSITRSMEAEADAFGLNAAREPDGFARAAVQLSEYRKMHPGKWEEIIFYDHPSGWNRIHRAMVWKAEHLSDPDVQAGAAAIAHALAGQTQDR